MPDTVVRVLPDVPAIDRAFDYLVPEQLGDQARVGTMVRVALSGRRVAGWVLEVGVTPEPGMRLSEVAKVVGEGPDAGIVDLCAWAAWRWAGRRATMLRLASPDRVVASLPPVRVRPAGRVPDGAAGARSLAAGPGVRVVEVAPTTDPLDVALAAAAEGQVIVVVPQREGAERIARGLRSAGAAVARWPRDWAAAAGGATVVGGRAAVFAPAPELRAIVVVDATKTHRSQLAAALESFRAAGGRMIGVVLNNINVHRDYYYYYHSSYYYYGNDAGRRGRDAESGGDRKV